MLVLDLQSWLCKMRAVCDCDISILTVDVVLAMTNISSRYSMYSCSYTLYSYIVLILLIMVIILLSMSLYHVYKHVQLTKLNQLIEYMELSQCGHTTIDIVS